jgi:hypothetical protein
MRPRSLCLVMAGLVIACASPASAQDSSAQVEGLFRDGKALMAEGKIAEACPKFLASYGLEHRVGTLLNLADCYEKNGQLASAWARFVEAKTLATRSNQVERATFAGDHADALFPRLSKLTLTMDARGADTKIRLDGVAIDMAVVGSAMPVDSGKHAIEVSAPGKKTWSSVVEVGAAGAQAVAHVPPLEDDLAPKAPPAAEAAPPAREAGGGRTAALVVGGVGVAGVVVGSVGGILALSDKSTVDSACNAQKQCPQSGLDAASNGKTMSIVSDVGFGVGIAGLAVATYLWFSGSSAAARAQVGIVPVPGGGMLGAAGRL